MKGGISQAQVADGSRPGALVAGLVTLAFLTLFPCAGYAQTDVPPPVHLQLAFDPPALTVAVGSSETVTLRLAGVPPGFAVPVALNAADETIAQVLTPESVTFTADTHSHDVTIESVIAGNETLTAIADVSGLPDGSTVAPAELAVTVVPPPVVREFVLRFETPEGAVLERAQVVAGSTTEVAVALENADLLEPGEAISVSVTLTAVVQQLTLTEATSRIALSIGAAADVVAGGTVEAMGVVRLNGAMVAYTRVRPATLAVEFLPRRFALRFETLSGEVLSSVEVVAGATTEVAVALENADLLEPGETISVALTAAGVDVSTDTVVLSMAASRATLTIDATGVAASIAGSVTATGVVLSGGSVVENTLVDVDVDPATLAVPVVREFILRFETLSGEALSSVEVVAGATIEVVVALENTDLLEPEEAVSVTLTAAGVDVSTDTVVLSMTAPGAVLTIDATGVAAGIAGSVTATGVVLSGGSAVENASVGPATLAAPVVREFVLRFETPEGAVLERAQVVRGSTTEVAVALENADLLEPGEAISVSVTLTAVVQQLTLTEATSRIALSIGAAVDAVVGGTVEAMGEVRLNGAMVAFTQVRPATLAVEFLPRRFVLRFETPEGAVLERAQVVAGSTVEVAVVLENADLLEPGETVSVTLTAAGVDVSTDTAVLSMAASRATLTVDATGVAASIAGSVTATGVVLSGGSAVEDTSVGPATLAVSAVREFVLRFETLSGEVLSSVEVVAGATIEVVVALEHADLLADLLEPEEAVSVALTAAGVDVSTDTVVLSMTAPGAVLTINATGVAGIAGSVTATGVVLSGGSAVENASVGPATLAVPVVREFVLRFETPEGAVLERAQVVAGSTTEVAVALENADLLEPGEAISVSVTLTAVVQQLTLTEATSRIALSIGAAADAVVGGTVEAMGEVRLNGAMVAFTQVRPATLAVEFLPRRFALRFETPEGTVLETAQVVAGSTVEVAVALENADLLEPGEAISVALTAAGVDVSTDTVVLSMAASQATLTVDAAATAMSGTLAAEADTAGIMNAVVEPATLAVEVVPRRFGLRFETPEGTVLERAQVVAGSTTEVAVALTNIEALEPGETVTVALTAETVSMGVVPPVVTLTETTPRAALRIGATVNTMSGTLTAEADTAGVMNVTVEPGMLAVEVLPRRFSLRFETPEGAVLETARVVAGSTVEVAVALENADLLEPGEAVSVMLTAEGVDVSTDTAVLSMTASGVVLTINATGVAAGIAGSVTATGVVLSGGSAVENTSVGPATLAVEVLSRRFSLRFETPEGAVLERAEVVAGGTAEVTVALTNIEALEPGETVSVTLTAETVGVVPRVVTLTAAASSATLTIDATGVAAGIAGSVTATGVVLSGGSVVESKSVGPATLTVPVVREFVLRFETLSGEALSSVEVMAGATTEVAVALTDVEALEPGEVVSVSVTLTAVVQQLTLTEATPRIALSIGAAVDAVAGGTVEATGEVLLDGAMVAHTRVRVATLEVKVVREFTLRFETLSGEALSSVEVVAGATIEVAVALENADLLGSGETVSVTLTAAGVDVSTDTVVLSMAAPWAALTVDATGVAASIAGSVTATGVVLSGGSAVENTSVGPATLAVSVVREFILRFETLSGEALSSVEVVAGATIEVVVALEHADLLADLLEPEEAVSVTLTAAGVDVSTDTVVLSMTAPGAVLTIDATGVAAGIAGSVTATGVVLSGGSAVENASVGPATLAVPVVREFVLRFETPEGTVLERAQVVAGSTTEVAVALENADLLEPGEAISVSVTLTAVVQQLTLTEATSRIALSIGAAVDAVVGGTVEAMGEVRLNGTMVAFTQVRPATLAVEFLPRRFVLRFETPEGTVLERAQVVAGSTVEVAVALENADLLGSGETVSVTLTAAGVDVSTDAVVLSMTASRATLTVDATGVAAGIAGSVTATGVVLSGGSAVEDTSVGPATLTVSAVREFVLRFETLSGEVLSSVEVVAGATIEVVVALEHADLLADLLEPGEAVSVTLTAAGVDVSTDTVVLSMTAPGAVLTINATGVAGIAGSVTATGVVLSDGSAVENASVGPATLAVPVVREFVLRFETPEGAVLERAQVVRGSTTEVAVALENADLLEPGEAISVSVTLTAVVQQLTLTEATSRIALSIGAAVDAVVGGTVEAMGEVRLNGAMVAFTQVRPATLAVEFLPRRFGLRFETPEGTALETAQVVAGSTVEVAVALENADLLGSGETVSVTLTAAGVDVSTDTAVLSMAASRATLTVDATGVAAGIAGSVTATGVVLSGGSAVEDTSVGPATLAVSVVREFVLRFETLSGEALSSVEVVAGATIEVVVALENIDLLEPEEAVSVTLTAAGVDVSTDTVVLSMTAPGAVLTIDATGVAAGIAGSVTATGVVLSGGSAVENASVGPATLAVPVVREFVLRFETPEGAVLERAQVVAGSTTEVAVALENADLLEPGEAISVSVTLTAVVQQLTLTEATSRIALSIGAAADAVVGGTVEAMGEVRLNGAMVAFTRVRPATLAVEFLPRRFALRFETPEGTVLETAQVVAGNTVEVAIALENADLLEPGEAISVALTAAGVDVSTDTVVLSMAASRATLTVDAAGVAAGIAGSVTAEADTAGIMNAVVEPATLAVEVVPRRFGLRFETLSGKALSSVEVVAGATIEVAVALENADLLEPGETVSVALTTGGVGVSTDAAVLSVTAPRATLTVDAAGVAAGITGSVMATGMVLSGGSVVESTLVDPATLTVEVVREFVLQFETLSGEALSLVEVVAGATAEVAVALTNVEALEPGEAVSVSVTLTAIVQYLTLTAATPRITLSIGAVVDAVAGGTVEATGEVRLNGAMVAFTRVRPATLEVEVLPRRFGLRFETPAGTVLERARVVAGRRAGVTVILDNAGLLKPDEAVSVTLTAETVNVSVVPPVVTLTAVASRAVLTIDAALNAMSGTLTAKVDTASVMHAMVEPATLAVDVLPRRFGLRFETPAGTALETVRVVAGSTTEVAVALLGATFHGMRVSEAIPVMLTAETLSVVPPVMTLTRTTMRAALRIDAAATAMSGVLTAEADTTGVMNMVVQQATLAVDVLPRRFALRFETPAGAVLETARVVAGSTTEVAVALADAEALESGETISVTLTAEEVGVGVVPPVVTLTGTTPRAALRIDAAVNAMSGTLMAEADTTGVMNVVVQQATLAVEVLPRRFALRFETPAGAVLETAQVVAGSTTEAVVALANAEALELGETISVTLTAEGVDVSTDTVVLSVTVSSAMLTIGAAVTATSGTLTAEADTTGVMNAVVEPETLTVTVVPAPVHLQLAFEPPALRVAAGAVATAVLSLADLPADAEVTVRVSSADAATAEVVTESLVFDAATTRREITIEGVAEGNTTLTAIVGEAALADSDLPPDSTVMAAELSVTVVPPPVRLQLAFEPPELTVAVGATETATLSLPDVPADAAVTVALSSADTATVLVMPSTVTFTANTPSRDVTIEGVAEGSATLTASAPLDSSSLPPNSTVLPAELSVTVPVVREFALRFETLSGEALSSVGVVAGATTEIAVALTNAEALEPGESVLMTLTVIVQQLTLAEATPRITLSIEAAADAVAEETVEEATGVVLLNGAMVAHTRVRPATLVVEVLPRRFGLRFETLEGTALERARVVAGSTTEVTVVLENAGLLEPDEAIPVTLTAEGVDVGVVPPMVMLTEATPRAVLRIGTTINATFGTLTAEADVAGVTYIVVEPATLEVDVLPRRFALRFETPEGTALETARVVAGSTTEVAVALTDAEALEPGETISVTLTAEEVGVVPPVVTLTAVASSAMLTIDAAANAMSGTLTAQANTAGVMNAVVELATLAVEVVPRRFSLRFETPEGTALETARVVAGSTTEVTVALTDAEALEPGETVSVTLTADTLGVNPPVVTLTGTADSAVLTIDAAVDAMSGTLTAEADTTGVMNAVVEPGMLAVEVLPRRFSLRFETPEGTALETVRVVAGSTTEVTVALTDAEALVPGEAVPVTLTAEGVDVSTDTVVLSVTVSSAMLTIGAAVTAMSGTLTAEADTADLMNVTVQSATLAVTVLPAPVNLQLMFEPPSLEVVAGTTATATLSLPGVPADAAVTVTLGTEDTATALVMPSTVAFTADTPNRDVTITGVAAGSAMLTASVGEAALADSDLPPDSTVESAELVVTVVPAPVRLQLAFEPPTLAVAVGSDRTVALQLLGDVPAGAAVTVTLSSADTATALVVTESVVFDADTPRHEVTLTGVAAGSVTITAAVDEDILAASLPSSSSVEPAQLAVTVVPVPVELALAFDPPSLTVMKNSTATAVLSLLDVPAGAMVEVQAIPEKEETAQVVTGPVVFDAATTSHKVTVAGVAAGNVTVRAIAVGPVGLPPDSSVAFADLAVTVVLPPVRLQLAFEPPTLAVAVGSDRTVALQLLGDVPAGAAVTVTLSSADTATVLVVTESVVFDADTPRHEVTLTGVAAGSATVTASADISGAPAGSSVASTELSVTVVPAPEPVMLQLAFDPPTLTVEVGGERTVMLRLSDVPAGAEVTVDAEVTMALSAADEMTGTCTVGATLAPGESCTYPGTDNIQFSVSANGRGQFLFAASDTRLEISNTRINGVTYTLVAQRLPDDSWIIEEVAGGTEAPVLVRVTPESVVFSATTQSHAITITGVVEGSVTLTAVADILHSSGLSEDSTVEDGVLPITVVVVSPVRLALAFEPPTLSVAVDSSKTVGLFLEGVPAGAEVEVVLTASNATQVRVMPDEVIFTAENPGTVVTLTGVAEGDVTVLADVPGDPDRDLPSGSTVDPAELMVTVVAAPVRLALAFEPPTLSVAVDSSKTVGLFLEGVPADAAVEVVLTLGNAMQVRVMPDEVIFTAENPGTVVTLTGVAEGDVTVLADVPGDPDRDLPSGSTVDPAELPVTVVASPVRLALSFEPPTLSVAVGSSETVTLSLPDVPEGAAVTVTLSTADTATALVTPESVTFTAGAPSTVVTLTGVAAGSVTLTASADISGAPAGSSVASTELPVTIVPAPVRLALAFEPPTLSVAVDSSKTVGLFLEGVPAGAEVEVVLTASNATQVRVMPDEVIFTAENPGTVVTLTGVAEGEATVIAVAALLDGLSEDSTVRSAQLAVTVVPVPVRLQLAFDPMTLEVAVGSSETVTLSLPDVPEGAAVTVTLSTADTATALVTPESVTFTANTPSSRVTVMGVAARSVTLTASADISGAPAGSSVASTELSVTVVPAPVDLQLTFEPASLRVAAGATATAVLRLSGVPAGAEVTVDAEVTMALSAADEMTGTCTVGATLAPGESCTYPETPGTDNIQFSVSANGSGQFLFATSDSRLELPDTTFNGVTYTLVAQRLPDDSWKIEEVAGSTEAPVLVRVTPESVVFTATTQSHAITITGVVEGSVTLTAVVADDSDLPPGSTVASARLQVTVVESPELQLRVRVLLEGPLQ